MAFLHATDCLYRFIVLFFNCMLTFGSYYCFDMPSVLQAEFTGNSSCVITNTTNSSNINETCCDDCLGMSPENYNLLYAIYAWTNALVVIGAGFLIDKLGNRVGAFLFSSLCVIGSSLFAVGAMYKGTATMLPLMLIGRLIFGSGNGSLTIVQNRITAFWFRDKELALAFGVTLAFSRLGSVLNFFLTSHLSEEIGLTWTLWLGAMLCGFGFVSAIIVSFLDHIGMKQLGQDSLAAAESKKLKFTDIRYLGLPFWLIALMIMFFYNGVFPFVADASKFIQDKYHFHKDTSSYLAGAVYDVSMILSPFLGGIIDVFGKRSYLALACATLTIPVFGILAFSYVYPLVATLWLGFTYSVAAASMWPSIPLVVSQATVGTAMGLTTSIQMIGIGLSNLIIGKILGDTDDLPDEEKLTKWRYVMIYLLANTICCMAIAVASIVVDKRRDNVLNQSRAEKRMRHTLQDLPEEATSGEVTYDDDEPNETEPLLRNRTTINT